MQLHRRMGMGVGSWGRRAFAPLNVEIWHFPINVLVKRLFLSFKWEKWNFTILAPPENVGLLETSTIGSPGKKLPMPMSTYRSYCSDAHGCDRNLLKITTETKFVKKYDERSANTCHRHKSGCEGVSTLSTIANVTITITRGYMIKSNVYLE